MVFTYLILKLAFQGVTEECNRVAAEQYSLEYSRWLKSRLSQLALDFEQGTIDAETFERMQRELLGAAAPSDSSTGVS